LKLLVSLCFLIQSNLLFVLAYSYLPLYDSRSAIMKVLATVLGALTLTVRVSAWYGSVTKGDDCGSGGCSGFLDLTDYNTGSTYWCGYIYPDSSSACSGEGNACSIT
jgi:hypothetical protein